MKEELLITRWKEQLLSLRVQDGSIVQIQAEANAGENILGNIYVAKVRNIVKNINAAFVEFQKGQMAYLPLNTTVVPIHTDGVPHQSGRVVIGDEIIVQVIREAVKTKPPTLSGKLELTGRYVVLTAAGEVEEDAPCQSVSISKKIREKEVRESLKNILQEYCRPEYGFVVRTNSAAAGETELRHEAEALAKQYEEMIRYGKHKIQFTLLQQKVPGYLSQIMDSYSDSLEHILTDEEELYQEVRHYLEEQGWTDTAILEMWDPEHGKLDAVYNISRTIEHALRPKVWLKSGGYLVIQPTEALVSIDVNTGKAIGGKKDVQKTFLKINLEAAEEIAKQLRLRNLSGIILIDFIDMETEENQGFVMESLRRFVSADPVQTTVVDMTKLGLVELTRKKIRKSLYEQLQ